MLKEFKEFAMKGNMLDLAVGLIIGVAFGKIVASLVADIIMPPIGILVGNVDFSDLRIILKTKTNGVDEVAIRYGNFIYTVFEFLIIALSIFLLVRVINKLRRPKEVVEVKPSEEITLLTQIRDLLRK